MLASCCCSICLTTLSEQPMRDTDTCPISLEAERQYNDSALTDENCFEVQIDAEQAVYSDQYTVQWFKWVEDGGSYAVSEDLVDQFKFNPGNIEESVFEENNDEQNIWGKYYAVITNYVNGSVAKVESEQYIVY